MLGPSTGTKKTGYPRTLPVRAATVSDTRYSFVWLIRSAREDDEWEASTGGGGSSEYGTESSYERDVVSVSTDGSFTSTSMLWVKL